MAQKYLCPNIDIISQDKYASNVAEQLVINDQYGNYVIQKLYEYMEKSEKQEIFEIVNKEYESNMTCLTDSGICALNKMRNDRSLAPFELKSHLQKSSKTHPNGSNSSSPVNRKNSNQLKSNSRNFDGPKQRNSYGNNDGSQPINIPQGISSNSNYNNFYYNQNPGSPTGQLPHNSHSSPSPNYVPNVYLNANPHIYGQDDYQEPYMYNYPPPPYYNPQPSPPPILNYSHVPHQLMGSMSYAHHSYSQPQNIPGYNYYYDQPTTYHQNN